MILFPSCTVVRETGKVADDVMYFAELSASLLSGRIRLLRYIRSGNIIEVR